MKNRKSAIRVKIRKIKPSDLDGILEIEKASFSTDAYSKKRLSILCKRKASGFALATFNDLPAAYLLAWPKKSKMEIISIAVNPKYRRIGIGIKLINYIIRKSKRMRLKDISLEVKTTNKKAIKFYEKIGFKTVKVLKRYYKDEESAQRMVFGLK
ncbi:MAG: ribosomal protein S18-alanine N-acetyltransferase [bacterium]|nr:ribosomal protein S18-alanine N-acetyltransferase [bacterium]